MLCRWLFVRNRGPRSAHGHETSNGFNRGFGAFLQCLGPALEAKKEFAGVWVDRAAVESCSTNNRIKVYENKKLRASGGLVDETSAMMLLAAPAPMTVSD